MYRNWHFNKCKMEMKTRHFLRSVRSCVLKVRISSANLWNPVSLHLIFKADFSLTRYWKSYQLVPSLDSKSDCTSCLTDPTYNGDTGLCPSRIVLSENCHYQNMKLLSKLTNKVAWEHKVSSIRNSGDCSGYCCDGPDLCPADLFPSLIGNIPSKTCIAAKNACKSLEFVSKMFVSFIFSR